MIFRALHRDAGRLPDDVCSFLIHLLLIDVVDIMVVGIVLVRDEVSRAVNPCCCPDLVINPRLPKIMLQDIVSTVVILLTNSHVSLCRVRILIFEDLLNDIARA